MVGSGAGVAGTASGVDGVDVTGVDVTGADGEVGACPVVVLGSVPTTGVSAGGAVSASLGPPFGGASPSAGRAGTRPASSATG